MGKGFNNIKKWLLPKLKAKGMSVEDLAVACGKHRTELFYGYMKDKYRPSTEVMTKICAALGVPVEEGLRQYTPGRVGRPKGTNPK